MRNHGWTLTELLIAVGLAVVLAGLAVPTCASLLADLRRSSALTLVHGAFHTARRLAAAHGRPVLLCGLDADGQCSGTLDWSGLALGVRMDLQYSPLQTWTMPPAPTGTGLRSNRPVIHFFPLPPAATPATVIYCDPRGPNATGAVILSSSGRPRVALGAELAGAASCS